MPQRGRRSLLLERVSVLGRTHTAQILPGFQTLIDILVVGTIGERVPIPLVEIEFRLVGLKSLGWRARKTGMRGGAGIVRKMVMLAGAGIMCEMGMRGAA